MVNILKLIRKIVAFFNPFFVLLFTKKLRIIWKIPITKG